MGLFSSKKKTYVNTSVARMVADEDYVPSNKMAMLEYTFSGDSSSASLEAQSLPDYIIRMTNNNIVARTRKARNYASKPEYAYGLPTSNLIRQDTVDTTSAIYDSLKNLYPEGLRVLDSYFGPLNNFFLLKALLQISYGYNYTTNELTWESGRIGFNCYMESAVIKYSKYTTESIVDPEALIQFGESAEAGYTPFRAANPKAPHVPWVENNDLDYDIAEVTVVYKDAAGNKQTYLLTLNFLEFESSSKPVEEGLDFSDTTNIEPDAVTPVIPLMIEDGDIYHAYIEYTIGLETHRTYFVYLHGAGAYPKLDNLFNVSDSFGSYIPRLYARLDGRKANDDSLKGSPEYKSMVGLGNKMGLNWVNWVDEVHNSVGSVGDVSQIYMTYSLPANTEDKLIQEYMYEYFMELYGRIPKTYATSEFSNLRANIVNSGSKQGQSIEIKDKAYSQQLSFSSIGYIDVSGSIGEVGTIESGIEDMRVSTQRLVGIPSNFQPAYSNVKCHYYRKQLTRTTYREVRINALTITERVKNGKTTVASGDSENLLIPLDIAIDHEFTPRQKEELYTKAMYIVLNTIKVVKQKWYQTGIFKAIMFVVAVVVTVFTAGSGTPLLAAVLYSVAQTIVVGLIIQMAVKLLVIKLGIDIGVVAAVVAVVAALYGGYHALSKTTGIAGITGPQLLSLSSQAFSMSNQGFALQTQEAIKDFNSLMTELSEEDRLIQEKAKEFGMGQHGALLMFEPPVSIGVRMGESPDNYFMRSIHTINLGSAIYSFTEMNVELGTQLPTTEMILNNLQELKQ